MGFADKLKEVGKTAAVIAVDKVAGIGYVTGADFSKKNAFGAFQKSVLTFKVTEDGDEPLAVLFTDNTQYIITHDMVKNAEILAMGTIFVKSNKAVPGIKYKVELTDGKTAILTVPMDKDDKVERILF